MQQKVKTVLGIAGSHFEHVFKIFIHGYLAFVSFFLLLCAPGSLGMGGGETLQIGDVDGFLWIVLFHQDARLSWKYSESLGRAVRACCSQQAAPSLQLAYRLSSILSLCVWCGPVQEPHTGQHLLMYPVVTCSYLML